MKRADLAEVLTCCGFEVKPWKDGRLFINGYGRELKIAVTPGDGHPRPMDGAQIKVTSTWRSTRNGLYCKGVKHALLRDLYFCGLISDAPPADWRQVALDEPATARRLVPLLDPAA